MTRAGAAVASRAPTDAEIVARVQSLQCVEGGCSNTVTLIADEGTDAAWRIIGYCELHGRDHLALALVSLR